MNDVLVDFLVSWKFGRRRIDMRGTSAVVVVTTSTLLLVLSAAFLVVSASAAESQKPPSNFNPWTRLLGKLQPRRRKVMYDREENMRNAVPALRLQNKDLSWYRLDDGVMGGRSESQHKAGRGGKILEFQGYINTDGGGFTSIRSHLPENALDASSTALRLHLKGDGKTYKVFLTNGIPAGGPRSPSPSWQADIPTTGKWQTITIPLSSLQPSFGGPARNNNKNQVLEFVASEMRQIGLMLSLRLANGDDNPKETFGEGVFPFSLQVKSIEVISGDGAAAAAASCETR